MKTNTTYSNRKIDWKGPEGDMRRAVNNLVLNVVLTIMFYGIMLAVYFGAILPAIIEDGWTTNWLIAPIVLSFIVLVVFLPAVATLGPLQDARWEYNSEMQRHF